MAMARSLLILPAHPRPVEPSFDQRVYAMVALIPKGQLATYGQIADLLGAFGCARQVGWALRRLPLPSDLPWHRVVNAKGCISLSLAREGSDWIQAELLRSEGIPVDGEGRLPLAAHRWRGAVPSKDEPEEPPTRWTGPLPWLPDAT
jgi:methylated-DNA-protein-cysteine methyltransferase-like protein